VRSQAAGILGALLLLALGAGCTVVDDLGRTLHKPAPAPVTPAPDFEVQVTLDYLSLLDRLARATPAEQAEIAGEARRIASLSPTFTNQLRYALVLALPGHGGSDPVAARAALGVLLARPEGLLPAELDLAYVTLQDINARLTLLSENQRLLAEADRGDKERQSLNRRLQAATTENARLKQDLDEALAKLEAVADLERNLAERQTIPTGQKP
jgi:hypothetical protein